VRPRCRSGQRPPLQTHLRGSCPTSLANALAYDKAGVGMRLMDANVTQRHYQGNIEQMSV
jgi:hypothetical protein